MLRLDPETRTPLRAAVAAGIALSIVAIFPSTRWYWSVLVAVILVNGNFGEGTAKGLTRLIFTIVGCVLAWAMFDLAGRWLILRILIMLTCIFWAVYFRGGWYGWFTLFITMYVVFLFSIFGLPTRHITLLRVEQTFIGCAVALAASLIVPMPRAELQWREAAFAFWSACADQLDLSFDQFLNHRPGDKNPVNLLVKFHAMSDKHGATFFETIWRPSIHRQRKRVMHLARKITQSLLSLDVVARVEPAPSLFAGHAAELDGIYQQARSSLIGRGADPIAARDDRREATASAANGRPAQDPRDEQIVSAIRRFCREVVDCASEVRQFPTAPIPPLGAAG